MWPRSSREGGDLMNTDRTHIDEPEIDESEAPSQVENTLLSVALFGGLVLFAVGCGIFGWFG